MALIPYRHACRLRGRARSQQGQASAEYAGVITAAVVMILALGAAFTPLGGHITTRVQCAIESVFSHAGSAACGTEPVPVTVGRPEGDEVSAQNDAADGRPQAPAAGRPQGPEPKEPVDQQKVNEALKGIREDLSSAWYNPVTTGDLDSIEDRLRNLNGAEVDAVIASMSDEELRRWVQEMEEGWGLFGTGGWTTRRRQEMWTRVLPNASYETVRRLAGITHDIQPRFDDTEGDRANKQNGKGSGFAYQESQGKPVVDGVSSSDIRQGQLGDCWYIAALKAVADADPSVIESAITDNGNGTYTVRLYHDGKPVYITVTGDQVVNPSGGNGFAGSTNSSELWPQIMEKALASYEGSYGAIEGGWSSNGMEILTGKPSTTAGTGDYSAQSLKDELDRGHAVALSTHPTPWWPWWSEDNPLYQDGAHDSNGNSMFEPLHRNHAYHVTAVDLGDPNDPSDDTVTVQNPWYGNRPMTLPYEDWKRGFAKVHVNPVK